MKLVITVLACLSLLAGISANEPAIVADIVLRGGKIATLNPRQPEATALAILGERIAVVGADADVKPLIGQKTRVIDLAGKRVVPGFHDSHVHLLKGGLQLSRVTLTDAADEAEFGRRLRAFDQKLPPGRWMVGGAWDHDRTFAGKLPDAALLDKYVADRPVFLHRYDGHMALANTRALKLAGIDASTPSPSGGEIERRPGTKEPTGLLRDTAMGLVSRLVPAPEEQEIASAVFAALAELRKHGITSVQDMDGSGQATRAKLFRILQRLKADGRLTARIRLYWPLVAWRTLAELGVTANFGDLWLMLGALKDFIDGSLGSSTAKMYEPYVNEPNNTGLYVRPRDKLLEDIRAADQAGLAVAVHGIGDRGNAELLDLFAAAAKKNGPRDRRFRIEHAQHLRPEDYRRFAERSVIASMQPYHIIDDGRWAEGRIGAKRCASSYACRSLLDAGAKLAFGSDWPVAPLSPLQGIDAAVNRRTRDGKHPGGWFPEQRITVREALAAYTTGSAFAAFMDEHVGTLERGKLADLVVLSRDILAEVERDRIADTEVLFTIVGGRIVYERDR
jgi:predicted amidohydrolase YtcJ